MHHVLSFHRRCDWPSVIEWNAVGLVSINVMIQIQFQQTMIQLFDSNPIPVDHDAIVLIQIVRTSLTVERIIIVSTVELEVTVAIVGCKAYISRVGLTRLLARRLVRRLFDLLVLKSVMEDLFGP